MSPRKQLRTFLKLVLLIILLDSLVNALPAAYVMGLPQDYLNESGVFYTGRFFQALIFHTIIYVLLIFWVHPILAVLYLALVSHLKRTLLYYIGAGMAISLIIYLLFAYNISMDPHTDYFFYRIVWYSTLGGLFGGMYYRKNLRISF